MTIKNKDSNQRLSEILNAALIPPGFRPKSNMAIEAMLETIGGEPLSSDKLARMLRKIEGKEPIGNRIQQEVDISPGVLNETQQELLMLYRSKGRAIPPEIQAMLDDMRKRAAESKDEEKDES
ncbi:MAG: hypothetical protein KAS29_14825 [Bacteroidales bacterium]|nr:hypothetical protein [Bacteroidales bacterium]